MNTAVINIKTDPKVKTAAQKVAKDLGMNLSTVLNAYLRQFIKTKTVVVSLEPLEPTPYLLKVLEESERDIKAGRVSPSFTNAEDAIAWLQAYKPQK